MSGSARAAIPNGSAVLSTVAPSGNCSVPDSAKCAVKNTRVKAAASSNGISVGSGSAYAPGMTSESA